MLRSRKHYLDLGSAQMNTVTPDSDVLVLLLLYCLVFASVAMCGEAEQTATTGHTTTTKQQDLISQILVDMSQGKYLNLKMLLGISK